MTHEIYLEWNISCNAISEAGNGDSRIAISKNDVQENWTKSFYQNVTIMTEYIRDLHKYIIFLPNYSTPEQIKWSMGKWPTPNDPLLSVLDC